MNDSIHQNDSYWTSVILVGSIFSMVGFVVSLIISYIQIGSEPSGSFFNPMMFMGVAICLATSFAGLVSVWHYTREVTSSMTLGRGALIGFLTGIVIVILGFVLNEMWLFIDPSFTENITRSMVDNIDAMDMPEETKQQMIDSTVAQVEGGNSLMGLMIQLPVSGLINLLTALIGVKVFADKEEEL